MTTVNGGPSNPERSRSHIVDTRDVGEEVFNLNEILGEVEVESADRKDFHVPPMSHVKIFD